MHYSIDIFAHISTEKACMQIAALFSVIVIMLTSSNTYAQKNKFAGWGFIAQQIKLNKKFSLQVDNTYRTGDNWKNTETYIMRAGIALGLQKGYSISTGYLFVNSWKTINDVHSHIAEHRMFQQIFHQKEYKQFIFQQRIRTEERWIPKVATQNNKFVKEGEKFNTRLRYWAKAIIPFSGNPNFKKGTYGISQEELMFNVIGAKNTNNKLFDQSRTFNGVGYRVGQLVDLELGHQFVFSKGRNSENFINNVIMLSAFLRW